MYLTLHSFVFIAHLVAPSLMKRKEKVHQIKIDASSSPLQVKSNNVTPIRMINDLASIPLILNLP